MKVLSKDIDVSGAGCIDYSKAINYANYENFGDYLSFMLDHGMNPIRLIDERTGLSPRGLNAAFDNWCSKKGLETEAMAKLIDSL